MSSITVSVALVLLSIAAAGLAMAEDRPAATQPTKPTRIVLVGDSTVTDSAGWGLGFKNLLTAEIDCINLAKGGRSSKSFRDEGHWDAVAGLGADYVLIQFGHNDQPGKGPARETDPATTFPANLKRYVEEARGSGAKAILITSLTRRKFGSDGKIVSDLDAYAQACRRAAAELNAPLIDLNTLSLEFCNALGEKRCEDELSPRNKDGTVDRTHLTAQGSDLIAPLVAQELVRIAPELAPYFRKHSADDKGSQKQ